MKLQNKVALITGACQGIGRGIAEVFAEECADIIVNHFGSCGKAEEVVAWIRGRGRRAMVVEGDVTQRRQVEAMFTHATKEFGPIDTLVNNAGVETIVPFLELTDEQWDETTNTNLRSEWLCSQVFCRGAVAAGRGGSIINMGSIQAARVLHGRTHYAPSKLAIEALTRNTAAEMGSMRIRVNCIHPGLIETPMTDWVIKHPDPSVLPGILSQIPLGRVGQPREIGTVAAFLASEEAKYVTGQSLFVDGGWAWN